MISGNSALKFMNANSLNDGMDVLQFCHLGHIQRPLIVRGVVTNIVMVERLTVW